MQDGKSGFGIRDSGFGIRESGVGILDSGVGILDSGFETRDSGLGIRVALVLVALPCVALAVVSAWWLVGGWFGGGLWPPDEVTLSEAIATRNNAEALRLISAGADPNRPSHVRDGLLTNGYEVTVTPVEAAVGAQRADSLRMLLANGASVDGRELRVLRCYERTRPDSAVRAVLEARATIGPSARLGAGFDCAGVRLPADRVEQEP
jgi:hypothetical protein